MKSPRRLAVFTALCGVLAGWVAAGLAGLGSPGIESTGAPIEISRATSVTARAAEYIDAPQAPALGEDRVSVADMGSRSAALSDPPPMRWGAAAPLCPTLLRCGGPWRYPCCSRR